MNFYKYYSYSGGKAAIDSQCYGFREPRHFNDPFELTYLLESSEHKLSAKTFRIIEDLKTRVCILCLTRSGLDPLMWAHYAESHKGFVVEYDVDDEFLTSPKYNLVPVQSGAVTYTSKNLEYYPSESEYKTLHQVFLQACGSNNETPENHFPIIESLYLKKHNSWNYEKEVRVVKLVDSIFEETEEFLSDTFRSYKIPTKSPECCYGREFEDQPGLKLFDKHQAKIKSISLGANNPLLKNQSLLEENLSAWHSNGVGAFFRIQPNPASWSLQQNKLCI